MKVAKWIALGLALVLLIAAGIAFYYFRQATALPDWYAEEVIRQESGAEEEDNHETEVPLEWEPVLAPDASSPDPAPDSTPDSKPKPKPKPRKHVLRGFHRRSKGKTKRAVKASRAVLEDGKLEAGVVLDLSNIPTEDLNPRDRKLYDRATGSFPGLRKRAVYVGIEDRPVTKDGVLQLGPNPKVRIGKLRYSLDGAAGKLGMSSAQLRREFNNELRRMKITAPNP